MSLLSFILTYIMANWIKYNSRITADSRCPPVMIDCLGLIPLPSTHRYPTIRTITKLQLSAASTLTPYSLAEPKYAGCNRLAEILGMSLMIASTASPTRRYKPKDLFDEVKLHKSDRWHLSGDDTVIAKPYSDPNLTELIGYFWSDYTIGLSKVLT